MIGRLNGQLIHVLGDTRILLDVNGVGYEISVTRTLGTALALLPSEAECQLYIHTHWRENDLRLFGFRELKEKELFELLISVSGIGPQLALAVIDGSTPEDFYNKILSEDTALLTAIKGIGKKTAERLVLELKDKLPKLSISLPISKTGTRHAVPLLEDVTLALTSLGYRRNEIVEALGKIPEEKMKTAESALREALGVLGKRRS